MKQIEKRADAIAIGDQIVRVMRAGYTRTAEVSQVYREERPHGTRYAFATVPGGDMLGWYDPQHIFHVEV